MSVLFCAQRAALRDLHQTDACDRDGISSAVPWLKDEGQTLLGITVNGQRLDVNVRFAIKQT